MTSTVNAAAVAGILFKIPFPNVNTALILIIMIYVQTCGASINWAWICLDVQILFWSQCYEAFFPVTNGKAK
jgi:hypothetical protein